MIVTKSPIGRFLLDYFFAYPRFCQHFYFLYCSQLDL